MGALGAIRGNGDLDLALTIRTFAIAEERIHLWVGGGVVWDSDPAAEIEESWTKAGRCSRDRRPDRGGGPALDGVTLLAVAVNGRGVVDPAEPVLRADDEALLRGRARSRRSASTTARPFRLPSTSNGLQGRPRAIGLPAVNRLELESSHGQALDAAGDARRRAPALSGRPARPADALAASSASSPTTTTTLRERGQRLISLRGIRGATSRGCCPGVKSTSYAVNMAAEAEAGAAAPTTPSSSTQPGSCWRARRRTSGGARGRTLFTPSLELGILAGVTRAAVIELAARAPGYAVEEGAYALERAGRRPTRPSRPRPCAR